MPTSKSKRGWVKLKPGRDTSLLRRHPWVFSGAIGSVGGRCGMGETVDVLAADGSWLACGAYSPRSQIRVRIWTFNQEEDIIPSFFQNRLEAAVEFRNRLPSQPPCSASRLVFAESDGLPGVIVDRYADIAVCQFLTAGAEYWRMDIIRLLKDVLPVAGIYERSDGEMRTKEGLQSRCGVVYGSPPPERMEIQEGVLRYWVDLYRGHKTGFYLDQRDNRALVGEFSQGAEVLNCFAYSGGFGLCALKGGAANLTQIDTSEAALELARENALLNGFAEALVDYVSADVFHMLRKYRDSGKTFDLVILDPPKFAASGGQVKQAARGYKDINLFAIKLLRPGGALFTFSCSGHVEAPLFQKIVSDAAADADRHVQIIRYLSQAADHPVSIHFPESRYLKGLLCVVR